MRIFQELSYLDVIFALNVLFWIDHILCSKLSNKLKCHLLRLHEYIFIHFAGNLKYSIHRSLEHGPLRTVGAVGTDQSPAALAIDGLVVAVSRGVDKSRTPER